MNKITYNSIEATDTIGIYGEWRWVVSRSGFFTDSSSTDSVVTFTLRPDGSYAIGLNGSLVMQGTYGISVQAYNDTLLHFNNFPQTSTSSQPGVTFVRFGTINIGGLIFFVDDELSISDNSLQLLSYPITPEAYISAFAKQ